MKNKLSLEEIFCLPEPYVKAIIEDNNYKASHDNKNLNRLIVTILLNNGKKLRLQDRKYVSNQKFNDLYLKTDDHLHAMIIDRKLSVDVLETRFDLIRKLIDNRSKPLSPPRTPIRISSLTPKRQRLSLT